MDDNKLVIGLTGMPGSGKSLVVEAASKFGYEVITMGDVIREETLTQGLDLTPVNVGKIMLELRRNNGAGVIAEKCLPKIWQKKNPKLIVDGLRSFFEAEVFQAHISSFAIIAVHSSPQIRFERLSTRGRSDDPKTWGIFHERDLRELNVGIGYVIALAEYVIINDGTKEELNSRVEDTLVRVEEQWNQ